MKPPTYLESPTFLALPLHLEFMDLVPLDRTIPILQMILDLLLTVYYISPS